MPPRGNEGLDFTPILTHYLFLFTTVLSVLAWFIAFISQAIATAQSMVFLSLSSLPLPHIPLLTDGNVGYPWFAIFLQLFLILGIVHTLATDSIAMHRFQISTFGAIAIVFAVLSVNESIFSGRAALDAMAAGWLILAIVDILWVLYFTSEEDSLALHLFNSLGTGGLSPPSRRRRTRGPSVHNMASNGYAANYSSGAGIGSQDVPYDPAAKMPPTIGPAAVRSQNSFVGGGSIDGAPRSLGPAPPPPGSAHSTPIPPPGQLTNPDQNISPTSPLIGSGAAGVGAGTTLSASSPSPEAVPEQESYTYKAKALYAYTASPDDPNEISFIKGEILDILDKQGKWWQARKTDGMVGIAPSNYLQII
ncbi:hypothetical protein J3R83DRAFT_6360 [Lanmaoa asiatica]|nr:hypothetical protein J3R83DRAFT_6360 [Lanmaoa asiatica]